MMKRLFFWLVTLTAATTMGQTSQVGYAGAQFLKIGVGAKYQALGEAAVASSNDVYSMYWNPAGLADIERAELGFTSVDWLLDVDLNYVAFARSFEGVGVFGLSAAILSMGDQEITTFSEPDGTGEYFTSSSYAVGLSYGRQLTTRFAFGGTFKFVGEKIHTLRSNAVAVDFGTLLYTGFRSLRIGMSMNNIGSEMTFRGSDLDIVFDDRNGGGNNNGVPAQLKTTGYELPLLFRMGMAYDFEFGPQSIVTLSGEFKHPNDNEQQGGFGLQYGYDDRFFLRLGQKVNYEEEGLSVGGGLNTKLSAKSRLLIDYAWQDFGRLESTQRFSVGVRF